MMAALVQLIKAAPQFINLVIMLLELFPHVVKLWRTWERVKGEKLTKEARREISADFKAGIAKAVKEKDTSDLEEMFRSAVND